MASFSAELEVDGQVYPLVLCTYSFTQSIGARGRVNEKVRHGLLEIVLDVPNSDQLLLWASTPHYPLDGHVSFFQANNFMALETVSFKAGQCVGYQETFEAGADTIGAYRCSLTIAAPQLELTAGGPAQSTAAQPGGAPNPASLLASAKKGYAAVQKAQAIAAQAQQVAAVVQAGPKGLGQLATAAVPGATQLAAAVPGASGALAQASKVAAMGSVAQDAQQLLTKPGSAKLGALPLPDPGDTATPDIGGFIPQL